MSGISFSHLGVGGFVSEVTSNPKGFALAVANSAKNATKSVGIYAGNKIAEVGASVVENVGAKPAIAAAKWTLGYTNLKKAASHLTDSQVYEITYHNGKPVLFEGPSIGKKVKRAATEVGYAAGKLAVVGMLTHGAACKALTAAGIINQCETLSVGGLNEMAFNGATAVVNFGAKYIAKPVMGFAAKTAWNNPVNAAALLAVGGLTYSAYNDVSRIFEKSSYKITNGQIQKISNAPTVSETLKLGASSLGKMALATSILAPVWYNATKSA